MRIHVRSSRNDRDVPLSPTLLAIRQWQEPNRSVDVQRSGPYRLWHRTHRFEAHGNRTDKTDVVRYTPPFGMPGRLAHTLEVRGEVRRIVDYRSSRN